MRHRRLAAAAALVAAAVGLAGCGRSGEPATVGTGGLRVVAAFYPLEFAAQQVGGDAVSVTNLTPAGAEPHDLELSPQQVADIGAADVVLYVPGFQPAVDRAVEQQAQGRAVDVTQGLTLRRSTTADGAAAADPHVWLNPLNMASIGRTVEQRLAQVDPQRATAFQNGETAFAARMASLDQAWRTGTATCRNRDLVVSHEAFGYLADRYRFTQVGIAGLSPDAEPSAAKVAEVADFVRANGVTTIYFETLVDPKVAQTVAGETGATAAVLDPLEGLAPGATGDYDSVMRQNLQTVRTGQGCS